MLLVLALVPVTLMLMLVLMLPLVLLLPLLLMMMIRVITCPRRLLLRRRRRYRLEKGRHEDGAAYPRRPTSKTAGAACWSAMEKPTPLRRLAAGGPPDTAAAGAGRWARRLGARLRGLPLSRAAGLSAQRPRPGAAVLARVTARPAPVAAVLVAAALELLLVAPVARLVPAGARRDGVKAPAQVLHLVRLRVVLPGPEHDGTASSLPAGPEVWTERDDGGDTRARACRGSVSELGMQCLGAPGRDWAVLIRHYHLQAGRHSLSQPGLSTLLVEQAEGGVMASPPRRCKTPHPGGDGMMANPVSCSARMYAAVGSDTHGTAKLSLKSRGGAREGGELTWRSRPHP